jgi:hypothetical protein
VDVDINININIRHQERTLQISNPIWTNPQINTLFTVGSRVGAGRTIEHYCETISTLSYMYSLLLP